MQTPPTEDWWTKTEIDLVGDRSRRWREQVFAPSDAVQQRLENGLVVLRALSENEDVSPNATVIEGGWDHEHCRLCFATISTYPSDEHAGYIDDENPAEADWLCRTCYAKYILPRLKNEPL